MDDYCTEERLKALYKDFGETTSNNSRQRDKYKNVKSNILIGCVSVITKQLMQWIITGYKAVNSFYVMQSCHCASAVLQ